MMIFGMVRNSLMLSHHIHKKNMCERREVILRCLLGVFELPLCDFCGKMQILFVVVEL